MQIAESDIDEILLRLSPEIEQLVSKPMYITGGSGFVGRWLIESLARAARKLGTNSKIISLNRSTLPWQRKLVEQGLLHVINADITTELHVDGDVGYVFHCATPASAFLNETNPLEMQRVIEAGAESVIKRFSKSSTKVVNVSSGAIYGVQPHNVQCLDDDWRSSSQFALPDSAYHRAKVAAEAKFSQALTSSPFSVVHARLFAFVAPFLPLDRHFAAGNFLKSAVSNQPITITGDGRTVRTYMYGTDLVVWLIAAAISGKSGEAYNIGSPHETTIAELAMKISQIAGSTARVRQLVEPDLTQPAHRYVPCTTRTERALGVHLNVGLDDAIERTVRWLRKST
jgi:UDP-glucuronate decarboxylase